MNDEVRCNVCKCFVSSRSVNLGRRLLKCRDEAPSLERTVSTLRALRGYARALQEGRIESFTANAVTIRSIDDALIASEVERMSRSPFEFGLLLRDETVCEDCAAGVLAMRP